MSETQTVVQDRGDSRRGPNSILAEIRRQNRVFGWKLRPRHELALLDFAYPDRSAAEIAEARRVLTRLARFSRR